MTLLLTYLFIAIGISFLCSILEAVLLSVTPGFVESELQKKPVRAKALKIVRDDLDHSISSILILNTFAHTMGAAGVGAQAVRVFGAEWESLIAFLLTLAILYFSEIIPKTIGATFWKQLALPSALIIRILIKILYPFVWVSAQLTRTFSHSDASNFSREELASLARLGAREGELGPQEGVLLENILQLRGTKTADILTPRTVISALDANQTLSSALAVLAEDHFTRVPVYDGDMDTVLGVAIKPRLLEAELEGEGERNLTEFITPLHAVPEELSVLHLLDFFIKRREHMFLVVDEYGQTAGIVSLEDAIETLLGRQIMDESDQVEDMQQLARSRYRERLRELKN